MATLTPNTNKNIGLNLSKFSSQELEEFWEEEGIDFRPIRFDIQKEQKWGRKSLLIEGLALYYENNRDAYNDFLRRLGGRRREIPF